jgi:lipopolysaccharide/colanic/teichoic acid biosynthesis glycosyltransferase
VLPVADLAALVVAVAVTGTRGWLALAYISAVLVILAGTGLHRLRISPRVSDQAAHLVAAATMPLLALLLWLPAGHALRLVVVSAAALVAARLAATSAVRFLRRRGLLAERALVVGAGQTGTRIAAVLSEHPELGLSPYGLVDCLPPAHTVPVPLLGRPADLGGLVREHAIDRVIVAFPDGRDSELVPLLRAVRGVAADVYVVPRLHEVGMAVPRAARDEVWGIPLIPVRRPSRSGLAAKRIFDVVAAAALLVLLGIPLLVLGVIGRRQLRRPGLFRQVRVTGPGGLAEIVKLRTLGGHTDPDTCWVVPVQQATRLGRFLRASHADELPQLLNVLRGQMSLVGPRPERPYFVRRFSEQIPGYRDRHRMRSGLTGWAQVHGLTGDTSIADRAVFDNAYIENWTFWLDLVILARTAALWAHPISFRGGQQ